MRIIFLFLCLKILFSCQENQSNIQDRKAVLDSLELYNLDSVLVQNNNKSKKTVLLYFNSECEYCRAEIEAFKANYQKLQTVNIMLISAERLANIKAFAQQRKLKDYPNLQIYKVNSTNFYEYFEPELLPSVFILDKQKRLSFFNSGKISIDKILENIK